MLSLLTSNVYFSAQQFETAENQPGPRPRLHSLPSRAYADTEEHDDPESTKELEETDKESAHACCSLIADNEAWQVIHSNFYFLSQKLYLSHEFLICLFEQRFITKDDYEYLNSRFVTRRDKVDRLLMDILPCKPPDMFYAFCDILRVVGQSHVAEKLEENPGRVELVSPGDICVSILLYCYDCKCSVYCRNEEVTRKC